MRPHIVLVTREVWPFVLGGGIGRAIRDVAQVLAGIADVTVLTGARHQAEHDRILAAGEQAWFDAPGIRFGWIPEPDGDLEPVLVVRPGVERRLPRSPARAGRAAAGST